LVLSAQWRSRPTVSGQLKFTDSFLLLIESLVLG